MKSFYRSFTMLSLVLVLVLASCQPNKKESKNLKEIITKTNITELFKTLRDDKDFTSEDFELLTNGMTRLVTLSVDSLLGKSVGQVIQIQKDFRREQTAASAANQATTVELVLNHDFKYIGIKPTEVETKDNSMKDVDFIVYEITNKSEKEIAELQGVLRFMDQNNQLVKVYPILSSKILKGESIKPGETKRIAHPFDHDVNNPRDEKIRNDHANLRPIWICTKIEFKDGSTISVTNTM